MHTRSQIGFVPPAWWLVAALVLGVLLPAQRASAQTITCFAAPTPAEVAVGNSPWGVAVGDFNRDGKLDMVVANRVSGTVSIRLGDGAGHFTSPTPPEVTIGNNVFDIAVGDIDGDGNLDFLVPSYNVNSVGFAYGDGAGHFAVQNGFEVGVGTGPIGIKVADVNNDGKLDFVTTNSPINTVSVRLGNGSGGFGAPASGDINVGATPRGLALGDINRDGKLDFLTANSGSANVSVRLGDGTGAFSSPATPEVAVDADPRDVALGDFNGDGNLDFGATERTFNTVNIRLGNGGGGFSLPTFPRVNTSGVPYGIVLGDFDGNGSLDIVTAGENSHTLSLRPGNNNAQFSIPDPPYYNVGMAPNNLASGDFNGDGALDVVVANRDTFNVSVRLNICDQNTPPTIGAPASQSVPEDGSLTFAAPGGNPLSVSDPDIGSSPAQVTLTAGHGTLTLATVAGLSFSQGDGSADAAMTVTGPLANVNAALNGLRYTPTPEYSGPDQLGIAVNDQGRSGIDGAKTTSSVVAITVTPVNDAPTAANDIFAVSRRPSIVIPAPGVLANDADVDGPAMTAVVAFNPQFGTVALDPNGGFTYTPGPSFNGTDSFTYRATDGSAQSDVATVNLSPSLPTACDPRPRVRSTPAPGGGRIQVYVGSTPLNTPPQTNLLQKIRFGAFQNARVTLNGQVITSGQTIDAPVGATALDFTVERATLGQATTVPFTVVDACGEWRTFVGGGPGAW